MLGPLDNKKNEKTASGGAKPDKIYPTPKSYDELARRRAALNELHIKNISKHAILFIGIRMYGILLGLFLAFQLIPGILRTNIISGVFFGFLIFLVWFGYVLWTINRVSDSFQRFGFSSNSFFLLYVGSYPILAFALYSLTSHISSIVAFILITCLHFVLIYIISKLILKSS